jgi:DNA-binding response OmpR family regulator
VIALVFAFREVYPWFQGETMTIRNILIISEQRGDFTTLTAALERADPARYAISTVSTLEQPVEALMDRDNDAVILAHSLETEYLLRLAQKARLPTPIVVLVDLESETLINKLKDAGASDYLVRGMLTDDLIHRVLDYSIALKGATRVVDTRIAREPSAEMMPRSQTGSARVSQLHSCTRLLRKSNPPENAHRW